MIKKSQELIKSPKRVIDFYFILSELFSSFNDCHVYIYRENPSIFNADYLCIPFVWLDSGIIVNKDMGNYKIGDKILKIGGKTTEELEKMYETVLFTENKYSLHDQANYYLTNKYYLQYFNLINSYNTVDILIDRNGESKLIKETISPNNIFNFPNHKWIEYNIEKENSMGYFYLNSCLIKENTVQMNEYENAIKIFFNEVNKNSIKTIVFDLRDNPGGYIDFIRKFISNLYVKNYNFTNREPKYNNKFSVDNNSLFKGKIYVLIGNRTASATVLITDIFRDNKLATIIGEPAGQKTCYNYDGPINTFTLPNTKFNCRLQSTDLIVRPFSKNDGKDALYPDVYISKTREDIINNNDPHMNYIRKILSKTEMYKEWEKILSVEKNHEFVIRFNKNVDRDSINSNNIYIENNFGSKYETTIEFINDCTIKIKAERDFTSEMDYILFIKNVKDNTNKILNNTKINFIIKD